MRRVGEGDDTLTAPNHHDFYRASADEIISLAARNEPVMDGFYVPGTKPDHMRTDDVSIRMRNS
ncbi:hypothetical protein ACFL6S_25930 [Candidatus Poribacteria bacterium]